MTSDRDNNMLTVDRIEGNMAVCEDASGVISALPLDILPPGVSEGDILRETAGGYEIDLGGTHERKLRIERLMDGLWEKRG